MALTSSSEKKIIEISDRDFDIIGLDCIWHNMDSSSDFRTFRRWYGCEMGDLLVLIGDRVRRKIFTVISLNATKHMIVITIGTQKSKKEMLQKWVDEDYWVDGTRADNFPSEHVNKEEDENLKEVTAI